MTLASVPTPREPQNGQVAGFADAAEGVLSPEADRRSFGSMSVTSPCGDSGERSDAGDTRTGREGRHHARWPFFKGLW